MDFINSWIMNIVAASIFVSLALAVTPKGSVKKAVQLASGVILVLVVLSPVTKIKNVDFNLNLAQYEQKEIENFGQDAMKKIIQEQCAAYIVNKAQAVGINVTVSVVCSDDAIIPEPVAVVVYCPSPEYAKKQLGDIIESDLGISPLRQQYFEN